MQELICNTQPSSAQICDLCRGYQIAVWPINSTSYVHFSQVAFQPVLEMKKISSIQ